MAVTNVSKLVLPLTVSNQDEERRVLRKGKLKENPLSSEGDICGSKIKTQHSDEQGGKEKNQALSPRGVQCQLGFMTVDGNAVCSIQGALRRPLRAQVEDLELDL